MSAINSDHLFTVGELVRYDGAELAIEAIECGHQNPSGQSIDVLSLAGGPAVGSDRVEVIEP